MSILNRIRYNSPVVLTFVLVSFGALMANFVTDGASNVLLFSVYDTPGTDPLAVVRLFTHVLGHTGWNHYLNNMIYFLLLGPMIEEKYGSRNLLLMMAVTALVTGLLFTTLFPTSALLGASGIVFMMIVLSSLSSYGEGEIPLTALLVLAVFLGQEIYNGMFTADNVSQLTHIAGGLVGCVMGVILNRKRRTAPPPPAPPAP
jgi:GlpG protein